MIHGSYDPILVILSYVIAATAGYTSLDMAARVREATGRVRHWWLAGAAIAMGGGIWSMHFVGMLAFIMPMPISYDVVITILSLLLPIAVCGVGLSVSLRATPWRILYGGCIAGIGIVSMHYLGMSAMAMPAVIFYDYLLVGVSILIALAASYLSLLVAYRIATSAQQLLAALVFGVAVAGMHYTGMAAASFVPAHFAEPSSVSFNPYVLSVAVASTTFMILLLCLFSSIVQRRITLAVARQLEHLVEQRTAALTDALAQKDLFVRETHHRVKNNLNVIISLLNLGERDLPETASLRLGEIIGRVRSIALVYEWLYKTHEVRLDLRDYLGSLLEQIGRLYGDGCNCEVVGDSLTVAADYAVPIGLLCNEAVTNAFKHAYPEEGGRIEITLSHLGEQYDISIRDFGIGLPDGLDVSRRSSIGLRLMRGLAKQVGGTIEWRREPSGGTSVILRVSAQDVQ